jgi:hypothetical protein
MPAPCCEIDANQMDMGNEIELQVDQATGKVTATLRQRHLLQRPHPDWKTLCGSWPPHNSVAASSPCGARPMRPNGRRGLPPTSAGGVPGKPRNARWI